MRLASRLRARPALVTVAGSALAQDASGGVRLLVQSSPLAGFRYHAAAEVWPELRVGDALELAREPDNPHDPNAIAVTWRGRKLGYVPGATMPRSRGPSTAAQPLQARISRLAPHPESRRGASRSRCSSSDGVESGMRT